MGKKQSIDKQFSQKVASIWVKSGIDTKQQVSISFHLSTQYSTVPHAFY